MGGQAEQQVSVEEGIHGFSDDERRRFQELEDELAVEDPALARKLGRDISRITSGAWKVYALLVAVAGFGVLIAGVIVQLTVLGVLGFLLACAGVYVLLDGHRWQGRPK